MSDTIARNIEEIRLEVAEAALRSGRKADDICLMAVTKFHSPAEIRKAYAAGIRCFGENRVQEALSKFPGLRGEFHDFRLDMIGSLQKNKVNKTIGFFDSIQSVDSVELLKAIFSRTKNTNTRIDLYFELHTGEDSKTGFPDKDSLLRACEYFLRLTSENTHMGASSDVIYGNGMIRLLGLMTMAPFSPNEKNIRESFSTLRSAFSDIRERFRIPEFKELSMGMSSDFKIAIEEGSTMVRIGTAIFGARIS
jgi:pyridoxal phosphate enzyme (YggS family)